MQYYSRLMEEYDYEKLLKRALNSLPQKVVTKERFEIPKGIIFYEGNTTILKIADIVNREPQQILSYLLKEVGTAGELDGERLIFQGRIPDKKIQSRIESYVERYVLCRECGRPDTKLIKKNRTLLLKCEACGAIHPVKAKKIKRD